MCLLTNSLWQWVMALKPLFEFLHLLVKHWFRYHCDWLLIFLMIKTCWKIGFYAAFFNVDEMFFKIYFRSRETAFYDFIKFSWPRSHRKKYVTSAAHSKICAYSRRWEKFTNFWAYSKRKSMPCGNYQQISLFALRHSTETCCL